MISRSPSPLAERARPRDLYDVINLFRNVDARPKPTVFRDVLAQKCECKGIRTPVLADMQSHRVDLEGGWKSMLAHQLPALPPVEAFWSELPDFFSWMEDRGTPQTPVAFAGAPGEEVIHEQTRRLSLPGAARSHLENIRFAASNRLVVELDYHGSTRRIEPYSLRLTRDGNIILHAHNLDRNQHRSYRVDRIQGARVTAESFAPRYALELTPTSR